MMKGYTFNRQRPILKHIADFSCKKLKLVIEVDGYSHSLEKTIEKDRIKQNALEKAGFVIIRFTDDEVLKVIENVRRAIEHTIEEIEINKETPPPTPSRGGQIQNAYSAI